MFERNKLIMVSTDETQDSKKCIGDEVQQLLAKQKRYAEARSVSNDVERLEQPRERAHSRPAATHRAPVKHVYTALAG